MPEDHPQSTRHPAWRRFLKALVGLTAYPTAILIGAGLIGQAARDRSVATALLMYVPILPLGLIASALDLAARGRSIPRVRFGLALLGAAAVAWSAHTMVGWARVDAPGPGDVEISVLHWNVLWGGRLRDQRAAAAQRASVVDREPDLVVLSEAPPSQWLKLLLGELGPGAVCVGLQHDAKSAHFYRLAVCSRWPVRVEERLDFPGGTGMAVSADVRGRHLRLLVVDGISTPTRPRLPFLRAIAEACRLADAAGRPYDLVLGDFNTPSRSLGFDDIEALGYRLAGRSARGWRGTFPSWLPIYDIDHVWLGTGLRIGSCTFFNGPNSDHRGQIVRILLPKEAPP